MAPTARDLHSPRASAHPYHAPVPSRTNLDIHARLLAQSPEFRVLLCGYRSKVCLNHRARKRDGSLHRFCEDHRQRANHTQKQWAQRRFTLARDIHKIAESDETTASQRCDDYEELFASFRDSYEASVSEHVTASDAQSVESSSRASSPSQVTSIPEALDYDSLWQSLGLADLEDAVEYSF